MKRFGYLLLCLPALATPQDLSGNDLLSSFVLTQKEAFFVAPPRLVSQYLIEDVWFNPGGQSAVLVGREKKKVIGSGWLDYIFTPFKNPEERILAQFWDTKTDSTKELSPAILKVLTESIGAADEVIWVSPSVGIIQTITEIAPSVNGESAMTFSFNVYKVDFGGGTVKSLLTGKSLTGKPPSVFVSKLQPVFYTVESSINSPSEKSEFKTTFTFTKYDMSGQALGKNSATVRGNAQIFEWSQDSKHLDGYTSVYDKAGLKPKSKKFVLNLLNNTISEVSDTIQLQADEQGPALDYRMTKSLVSYGETKKTVQSLWILNPKNLGPKSSQVQVASDVENAWMSPEFSNIAFVSHGKLFSSEIIKMDLDAFAKAKEQAELAQAMSNTKQVATAVMIYTADYDDALPLKDGFSESVLPYLKNQDILANFVYTYSGGPLSGLKEPEKTEIGYSMTARGKCVAYADGHVKFIKNP